MNSLPILRIHDADFYVDLRNGQFTQVDNPDNAISFRDIQDNGSHCLVLYDTATKNAFQGTWTELQQSSSVVQVRLPGLTDLDPVTLSQLKAEKPDIREAIERAAGLLKAVKRKQWNLVKAERKQKKGKR